MLSRDPLELDREVRQAALHWRRARRALRSDATTSFTFSPRLRSEELFRELQEAPDYDPLARPLLRWIHRLSEDRELWSFRVSIQNAWAVAEHPLDTPLGGQHTRRQMLLSALTERQRREEWLAALVAHAEELSSRVLRLWERRQEFTAQRRALSLDEMNQVAVPATLAAEKWLTQTRDIFDTEFRGLSLADYLECSVARDRADGWPARVSPAALKELLAEADWFRGLAIDAGPLPRTLGVSSFLRALARLGAAIADAGATTRQPFALAHDAYGLGLRRFGALFAMLPHNGEFARRRLGLGSSRQRDHLRSIARLILLESRALALRVLLRKPLLDGKRALSMIFPDLTHQALGVSLPAHTALALFRVHTDDAQRFAGLLLAASRTEELIHTHDEDWFRNPRAVDELRAEAEAVPQTSTSQEALDASANTLLRALRGSLG